MHNSNYISTSGKLQIHYSLHINLKALLCLYYQFGLLYVLIVLSCLVYQTVLWLTFRNPCDMFPSRSAYTFFNLCELYCLMYLLASQPLMSLERTIATIYVDTYERSTRKASAIFYVIAALLIPGFLVYYVCNDVYFTEPNLSCFTDQSAMSDRIAAVSMLAILLSLSSVLTQRVLAVINARRKARAVGLHLSTAYQLSENVAATSFVSWILFLQLSLPNLLYLENAHVFDAL
ncbi:hypothetical protein Y032_0402g812 [Ancylostoma ceylanicum]|uniref:G-protein coupled receptors family 1 profile domain-containing protein n=1 Tax=Ancylostoma ceylanicum TaxID=53326 RepID=A0A016X303_9BILA|nr:hypothetical protein Y032_0402g812 [Ancylostoma ceylanicum]